MIQDSWKKFDQSELTHSGIHHLVAINNLLKEYGYARAIDIANFLDITRASVSITIHKLKDKGYIAEDKNKFLRLSDKGKEIVNSVLSKRRIVKQFFKEVLNLGDNDAEENACKIEHLLSEDSGKQLISFMGFFLSNDATAKNFREKLRKFSHLCGETKDCNVCELKCFFKSK
jgi:DtxR family Mn-dependent transcriptional regulator